MATVDVIANRSTASEILGKAYFETDTNSFIVYNGYGWVELESDGTGAATFPNQYSVNFDGTNDVIALGNLGTAGRSLGAMLFWVNVTSTNGIHSNSLAKYLASFGGSAGGILWGYWGTPKNLLGLYTTSYRTQFDAPVNGDKLTAGWHLIGLNHNGSSYDIIIDGVTAPNAILNSGNTGSYSSQVATSIISGTDFDNVAVMAVHNSNYATQGLLDEVAIWDSGLTSQNLTDIYNSGVPADLTSYSPDGWWRMGDYESGTGTTITDQGSGGNDGTLTNGPTFSTTVPS
jgi:hypothetical protein